mmetsp:Transcript_11205/g.38156  ORF Transcript_11205/g.38156 Transcript_11205/m.38156 type:complete len:500 (-) Transcript_11205:2714-4213(-)
MCHRHHRRGQHGAGVSLRVRYPHTQGLRMRLAHSHCGSSPTALLPHRRHARMRRGHAPQLGQERNNRVEEERYSLFVLLHSRHHEPFSVRYCMHRLTTVHRMLLLLGLFLLLVELLVDHRVFQLPRPLAQGDPVVGDVVEQEVHGDRREAEDQTHAPLPALQRCAAEPEVDGGHLNEDDLYPKSSDDDSEEHIVIENAFEHVEFVVDLAAIYFVENLEQNKRVENHGHVLGFGTASSLLLEAVAPVSQGDQPGEGGCSRVVVVDRQRGHVDEGAVIADAEERDTVMDGGVDRREPLVVKGWGSAAPQSEEKVEVGSSRALVDVRAHLADVPDPEDEREEDEELPDGVGEHVLDHDLGKDGSCAMVGEAIQQLLLETRRLVRIFSGEGEGSEGVHDEVDPQQLDDRDGTLRQRRRPHGREDAGDDVDGELELKELADVVVHAPPPLDSCDDGLKVVVEDHNVSCLLCYLSAVDEHGKADVSLLQRRSIVRPVPSDGDNLP